MKKIKALLRDKGWLLLLLAVCISLSSCSAANGESTQTSESAPPLEGEVDDATFVQTEYSGLIELRFDDFGAMSVNAFRQQLYKAIDQEESFYQREIDRATRDNRLDRIRYTNSDAAFILNTLAPLSAEKWKNWKYGGVFYAESGMAEYAVNLTILDADRLTINEHSAAWQEIASAVQTALNEAPEPLWSDEEEMQKILEKAMGEALAKDHPNIQMELDYIDLMPADHMEQ